MIIFLLVIMLNTSGVMYINGPPTSYHVVSSQKSAAILLWDKNDNTDVWSSYHGTLYKVDIEKKTVLEIEVPKLKFEKNNQALQPTGKTGG